MISPDSLRNERIVSQYTSSSNKLHEQERDILKPWTDENLKIALIGFENQTNPDKYMPVRIFGYIPNDKRTIKHVDEVLKFLSVMSGDDRYEKILAFSNGKGQVRTMCDVAQRLEDRGRMEGLIAGRKEGRSEGLKEGRIEVLVTLVKSGSITVDTAAGILKITTTEFKKYL